AIGIENVGGAGHQDNLTAAQLEANGRLVRYLKNRFPAIKYLIGHYQYREFEDHPLWLERDPGYRTVKNDPSRAFMSRLRGKTADLGLKSP
ncbi:MAG: N-acetylmuramoyl-L-alanine amidase, partial [Bradyrhizobium sp.]|nr:N-acetylmuramoyl-L-alanine amidase [Bradyrhizobium sp.]